MRYYQLMCSQMNVRQREVKDCLVSYIVDANRALGRRANSTLTLVNKLQVSVWF